MERSKCNLLCFPLALRQLLSMLPWKENGTMVFDLCSYFVSVSYFQNGLEQFSFHLRIFFFMFQIMIIPTLEELLCNERTLYKRLVFSLLLLSHYPEAFSEDTEHCAHQALPLPKHLTFSHTALLFVPSTLIVHPPALPSHFCSCGHFPGTPFVLSPNLLNPHPLLTVPD